VVTTLTVPATGRWRDQALCADAADPEIWFQDCDRDERDEAVRVCAACPVMRLCRQWALAVGVEYGVWGGLDEAQRRALRSGAPLPTPTRTSPPTRPHACLECGTPLTGAQIVVRALTCGEECRLARKRRRPQGCGTSSGYARHRASGEAPCPECRVARERANESKRLARAARRRQQRAGAA
jgi:WhiB family redox-sensing transcriptional regulator